MALGTASFEEAVRASLVVIEPVSAFRAQARHPRTVGEIAAATFVADQRGGVGHRVLLLEDLIAALVDNLAGFDEDEVLRVLERRKPIGTHEGVFFFDAVDGL